jgi:hypothetical protein
MFVPSGDDIVILHISCAIAAVLVGASASQAGIVQRAEATQLRLSSGKTVPRVVRDKDGHVTVLKLNGMRLSQDDFLELGQLKRLRALVLVQTNIADDDLSHLKQCPRLDHLNLSSTEVTDHAIDTILELKSLTSVCLGNVRITPQALDKLKERNRERAGGNQLRWGYSQRKD